MRSVRCASEAAGPAALVLVRRLRHEVRCDLAGHGSVAAESPLSGRVDDHCGPGRARGSGCPGRPETRGGRSQWAGRRRRVAWRRLTPYRFRQPLDGHAVATAGEQDLENLLRRTPPRSRVLSTRSPSRIDSGPSTRTRGRRAPGIRAPPLAGRALPRAVSGRDTAVDSELRRFSPRDPGESLDGIARYLYPPRFTTPKPPH